MENFEQAKVAQNEERLKNQHKSGRGPRGPFAFLFIFLVVIDQAAKFSAQNIFRNYKFAFSLPVPVWLIYPINIIILAAIGFYLYQHYQNFSFRLAVAWVLILSGALCNIV